jgi:hypothetical protein
VRAPCTSRGLLPTSPSAVKKRCLLQNKQLAKSAFPSSPARRFAANPDIRRQNSALYTRIDELGAQISQLSTENVYLRSAHIELAGTLRRERVRAHDVVSDVEAAVRPPPFFNHSARHAEMTSL